MGSGCGVWGPGGEREAPGCLHLRQVGVVRHLWGERHVTISWLLAPRDEGRSVRPGPLKGLP